jgi:hypothetical protein
MKQMILISIMIMVLSLYACARKWCIHEVYQNGLKIDEVCRIGCHKSDYHSYGGSYYKPTKTRCTIGE